nr:MAG: hypothetical protein DIU78_07685 [Pseudomonadota bacterium]
MAAAGLFVTAVAAHADAATSYWIEGVVKEVELWDEDNYGEGSGQGMTVWFAEGYTGNFCNGNGNYGGPGAAKIPMDSTPLFSEMVRTAQAAALSGKRLRIRSTRTTSSLASCRVSYMLLRL